MPSHSALCHKCQTEKAWEEARSGSERSPVVVLAAEQAMKQLEGQWVVWGSPPIPASQAHECSFHRPLLTWPSAYLSLSAHCPSAREVSGHHLWPQLSHALCLVLTPRNGVPRWASCRAVSTSSALYPVIIVHWCSGSRKCINLHAAQIYTWL